MSFSEWSNNKKKKKQGSSFSEWSDSQHKISAEQEREDARKREAYLASREDDIAPVRDTLTIETTQDIYDKYGKYFYESDFADLSKPTGSKQKDVGWKFWEDKGDDVYDFINDINKYRLAVGSANNSTLPTEDGETYRDAFDRMLLAQQNGHQNYGMPDAGAPYGDYTKYSHMTKFEVAVYNYLYSSKGKDAAQEFLNDLESALTYRQGATEAEEIQGLDSGIYKTLRYTEESIGGGLEQFGIGVKQLFSEEQLPTTAGEITNALLLEDLDGWKKNLYSAGNVIGNMAPSLAVGAINPTAGMALQGASGGGNAYRQALAEGKTEGEAKAYGVMMGSMEFLTSKLLGGVAGMTGNLPSKALSKVSTFSNSLLRVGAKYGISLASEVTEEELQLWLEPAVRSIAFGEDYDAPELEEMAETAIVTMISTGVLNSSTDIATGQFTKVNGLSVNEAKVIEAEVNNRVAEAEADGKKLTGKEKEKIRDKVVAEAQRGYISTDTIESVLGGNSYENYKNLTEQENTLKSKKTELENEIKELVKTPEQQFTIEQRERLDSLREEAKGIKEQIKGLDTKTAKTNLFNEVLKLTEKDTKLRDVMERSTQKLDIDVSKYDGVAKKTVENAIKAGANNTTRVRDFVEFAAKISNETGFEVDYGRDASFEETRAKLDVDRVNESISDKSKKIILNMDSATALNDLLGHAVTHKTEKAAHYAELQKAFQDFIGEDAYKAMKAYTSDTYKNQKSAIPDNEITAKLSGQYLFTDEKFIKRLSTEHQNLFQFVFDEIKHWARMANAGSKEARQLEKIMHLYEKCYREAFGELKAQGQAVNAEMASTSYALVGKNENGQDVYVSSPEVMAMSKPDRIKKFRNDFLADFRGRTAKFERNGHTYYVRFVESMKGLGKLAYEGESKSSPSGLKAKIRVLADGNAFELVEDPSYLDSEKEKRKTTQAHKKAEYWDYYYKTVVVDGKGYDVYIDIRNDVENGDYSNKEPFVYSIRFEDNKNVATSVTTPATQNSEVGVNLDATTDDIIPQNSEKSSDKENFSLSKDSNGNITDQSTDYAYGETYYTMSYKQDGKVVGTLEYGEYEGQPNVKMIQVLPEYRRKGIGTKLLQELQRKYPNQEIDFGMSTPDGTKLLESVTYDVTDDAVVADRQKLTDLQSELDELQAKLDVLYDTENLTEEQEAEMHRLGDRWEEVYHAINELEPELRGKKASKTFVRTDDTQFSLSANPRKADADYIKAVESGDTETAQKMVDEAAKNAGYSIKAYHGTGYDFTVFDKSKQGDNYQDWGRLGKGFYFAPTSREAETWAELSKGGKNKVMPVYLSSKNMLDSFEALPDNLKDTIPENWDSLTRRLAEKYAYNYIEYMQEFGYDVQKILTEKGYDGINGHTEFVVYDPEQVKSADAITYDDSQNVIPLSQRFDSSKTDIRFSLSNGKNTPTPQGNFYVYGKDFTVKSDIAPVREDIAPDTPTAENVTAEEIPMPTDADAPPIPDEILPMTEEEANAIQDEKVNAHSATSLEAIQTELANVKELRSESFASFEQKIANKQAEYNAKKNKDTKTANNLRMQIERLKRLRDSTDSDYAKRISTLETREKLVQEGKPTTRQEHYNNIMNDVKATFSSVGFDFDDVLEKAKNLSTFSTVDNTPQRVMEKALGYKEGQVLSDLTVNKVAQNETEGIKWLNSFTDRKNGLLAQISKQYNIKPGSKESAAAQMYAEGFYVTENDDIVAYGDAELAQDFPDATVRNNIKGLAQDQRIRQIYDETLEAINESRTRNAYPEIQKLDNYFLHFRAMEDTFSKLGLPFNPNDIRAKDLPTDLNGVTADLKPGQPYFASSMHRKGKRTSFDLLGGLERYLTSAKNQIYHIDDIQTLRALRNYIADTYGQAKGLEGIDALTEEEAQERVEQVYGSHLSTFAKFLNEEANVLAGKTALIDRGLEGIIGRRGMTFLDTVNKQTGSNLVGFSISSPLTNFLSAAQAFAKTSKFDFLKAFTQTVSNKLGSITGKSDNFAENSPVIIRRKGAERFYRTPYQKAGDWGYVLMGAVDDISTELIARTKYNELTRKGMDEQTAHFETDKWVSRLMGDRSLGQQPQLFNSKTLGVLTKFQLEVRNQLDSQFYDTIQEAKVSNEDIENGLARNAKIAAKVTSTFVQLAVAQHLFGKAFESVAGYNPAFDIISTLATMFGADDDEESEDTVLDNIEQGFLELLEDLPYTSVFTGGRIPISNALPIAEVIQGKDSYGNEKPRLETIGEALPYYVLPGGYGQLKKTIQGLGMFSDDHPVAGSYTDSGNLRFPVEDTPLNILQAGLFGQYASKNAREYFDNDYAPLKEKQIQEYIDVDMPIKDYWEYRKGLSDLAPLPGNESVTLNQKGDYIGSLDLPVSKKNILINNIADRSKPIDFTGYENYSDFEEFDFATRFPEKYAVLKEQGISVADYKANYEETAFLYTDDFSWAANNPEKYTLSKAVTNDVEEYKRYTTELYNIEPDKDSNGKSISGSRKEKVLDYINNLDLDYGAKLILFKSEFPSDKTYNYDIINYVNSRSDLTYEDRVTIYRELGFRVTSDGRIYAE